METLAPAETLDGDQPELTVPVAPEPLHSADAPSPAPETLDSSAAPAAGDAEATAAAAAEVNSGECIAAGNTEGTATAAAEVKSGECVFSVGDLVWGKIKNHPWWPGQVYNTSRASERAQRTPRRPERSLLVAYFGDHTFSWCEPSQLRPFFPEFKHLSKQNALQSKGFMAAVAAALDDVAEYLESRFACGGMELGEGYASANANDPTGCFPIDNFTSLEFIGVLLDVARDVRTVDLLEATMLRTWVLAFSRGRGWAGETYVYHQGKEIKDLVDKIDLELDAPAEEHEEGSVMAVSKGLDASKVKLHSKKKRNGAAPVAKMDLNLAEIDESYTEKHGVVDDKKVEVLAHANDEKIGDLDRKEVNEKDLKSHDVEGAHQRVEVEQGFTSEKRERKKSKYLSPPYTNLANIGKLVATPKGDNRGSTTKDGEPIRCLSRSSINIGGFEGLIKEINEQDALTFDARPAGELLSDLLATALNIRHLKWNRPGKTVVGFFALYRCSVYCSGSSFKTYQNNLNASCSVGDGKVVDNVITAEGSIDMHNSSEHSVTGPKCPIDDILSIYDLEKDSKGLKGKTDGADVLTQSAMHNPSQHVTKPRKRKAKTDEINNGVVLNPNQGVAEHSVTGLKRMMREAGTDGVATVTTNVEITIDSMNAKSAQRAKGKSKVNANGETVSDLGPKSGRKRRKIKAGCPGAAVVIKNLENTILSAVNLANSTCPAILQLTFSPGTALPTKDQIISVYGKNGGLIESETIVLKESSLVSIAFSSWADAVKAFNDQDMNAAFKPPAVSYSLCNNLPGNLSSPLFPSPSAGTPLYDVQKNLQMMISTLGENLSSINAVPSDALKPEAKEKLVDEMQVLLSKVNKLLTGASSDMSC